MCISLESTKQRATLMLLFERYSHKFLDKILQEGPQDSLSGTAPSCLPSHLPDVMQVTVSLRLSPSVFAYCKRSKTGGGNGLGTRLAFQAWEVFSLWCVPQRSISYIMKLCSLIPMLLVVPSMLRPYFSGKICVPGLLVTQNVNTRLCTNVPVQQQSVDG